MSLTSSMYTAANGMSAHTDAMNVVSDNIANVNTTGFKESRARFADVIGSVPGGVSSLAEAGQGTSLSGVDANFSQGALQTTGQATHLALNGAGFFLVHGNHAGVDGTYYTRDGSFHLSQNGTLETQAKQVLQGYLADSKGVLTGGVSDLALPLNELAAPSATANITMSGNLTALDNATTQTFDPTDPVGTSATYTTISVYDSLGGAHELTVYYSRGASAGPTGSSTYTNSFNFNIMGNPTELTGNTATSLVSGNLFFDENGALAEADSTDVTVNFIGAAQNQVINLDFGDPTSNVAPLANTGVAGMTCYDSTNSLQRINQDGYASGGLSQLTIDPTGKISGSFSNGVVRLLGQVATANFIAPDALQRVGDNLFVATFESGQPSVGASQAAAINAGNLEQSTVNLANNFIDMMSFERGFQANTRTVQTLNQMLAELVNLGR